MLKYTKVEKSQKLSKYNLCLRPLEYYEYYAAFECCLNESQ